MEVSEVVQIIEQVEGKPLAEPIVESNLGKDMLFRVIDRRAYSKFILSLNKGQREFGRRVMEALIDGLEPKNKSVGPAMNSLGNLIRAPGSPENTSNQLFKIGNLLGVKP